MFILATVADTIRIPPSMLAQPTLVSVQSEMDKKYPNRVIMDVGLVISRYGDALQVGDGVCAAGDGGAHHEVIARLIIFRPFVEEVCLGFISHSSPEGIHVSIGFFDDIFIPAYWMLRPSRFDKQSGLWIWTPKYDDDDGDENEISVPLEVKQESQEENKFEMEIGSEIRFKVKSINFTQVTNTAKGVQATTTTTAHSIRLPTNDESKNIESSHDLENGTVKKRNSSVDLSNGQNVPATMHIVASICEDGLGLTSWWLSAGQEDEEDTKMES
jgi:DNA-directed RNA polymerase III subunit RPC8